MTISCALAPIAFETVRAYVSSLNACSLNATENVSIGWSTSPAIVAAIALLSRPPERKTPSGTSLISRSFTDSVNSSRKRSTTSRVLATLCAAPMGMSQYWLMCARPRSKTSRWPGCSLRMPLNSVSAPAVDLVPKNSGSADMRASGSMRPLARIDLISEPNSSMSRWRAQ